MNTEEWVERNPGLAAKQLDALKEAIEPFAEKPSKIMDEYACHKDICSKEKCGRCSRSIAAYKAMTMYDDLRG